MLRGHPYVSESGGPMSDLKANFLQDLAEVSWRELRIHLQRDAIIVVAEALDLVTVAEAVSADDKDRVQHWISSADLTKPAAGQIERWESNLAKPFRMLIVKPFILIQEVMHG